jgi:AcrR family transcriptional regulator
LKNRIEGLNSRLKLMIAETKEMTGTKLALIEAASGLFAEKGFEVVSVREITGRAGANVASVKYHFGSREGLIDAVVARMVTPVNEERLRRLDALEDHSVRALLVAFFEPLFSQIQSSPLSEKLFVKLMGRVVGDRPYEFSDEVMGQFREVAGRYVPAFMKACSGLSSEDVFWRIHFSYGVLSNTLMHGDLLKKISEGKVGDEDISTTLNRVIDFCEAGFQK